MLLAAMTAQLLAMAPTVHAAHLIETADTPRSSALHLLEGQTPSQPQWDPYANSVRGVEVGVGALGVLIADLGLGLVIAGTYVVAVISCLSNNGGLCVGGIAVIVVEVVASVFLVPLGAALGANIALNNAPKAGTFGMAYLLALGAEVGGAIVFGIGGGLLINAANGSAFVTLPLLLIDLAYHFVVLPLAASFGLHWGSSAPPPQAAPAPAMVPNSTPVPFTPPPAPNLLLPSEPSRIFSIPIWSMAF